MTQPSERARELLAIGRTPQEVAASLERELATLDSVLQKVQPHWNTLIPDRQWTAAQEAEHILLVNEGAAKVSKLLLSDKPLRETPRPAAPADTDGKHKAPSLVQPTAGGLAWADLQERYEQTNEALKLAAAAAPQSSERQFFHPAAGDMDTLGWLRVTTWHIRHHRLQLEKLLAHEQTSQEA